MRLTAGLCTRFGSFIARGVLGCVLRRFIGRPIVVALAAATTASASRALGLLSVLLATGVVCVTLSGLLMCVRRLVTLGLAVSPVASTVAVVSAAAVALTVVVAVLAVVALSVTGSVTGPTSVLRTLTAAISLALFRFRL